MRVNPRVCAPFRAQIGRLVHRPPPFTPGYAAVWSHCRASVTEPRTAGNGRGRPLNLAERSAAERRTRQGMAGFCRPKHGRRCPGKAGKGSGRPRNAREFLAHFIDPGAGEPPHRPRQDTIPAQEARPSMGQMGASEKVLSTEIGLGATGDRQLEDPLNCRSEQCGRTSHMAGASPTSNLCSATPEMPQRRPAVAASSGSTRDKLSIRRDLVRLLGLCCTGAAASWSQASGWMAVVSRQVVGFLSAKKVVPPPEEGRELRPCPPGCRL
jgi:hypothetical protein